MEFLVDPVRVDDKASLSYMIVMSGLLPLLLIWLMINTSVLIENGKVIGALAVCRAAVPDA